MKFKTITLAVLGLTIIFSCGNPKTEKKEEKEVVEVKTEPTDLEKLELESSRLRGGGSIKKVDLENGKATIEYVKDYKEYKKLKPHSRVSKSDLDIYWSTGDAIEKALVDGSVRIMKKLNFINQVEIILPNNGIKYSINVKKSELEKFIGSDFITIKNNWEEKFSNPYVYDDNGRAKFFKKFGEKR